MEGVTILVVDDEFRMKKLVKDFLLKEDCTVLEAGDGEEAIKVFNENKEKINLILLDVMMPKLDGWSVLRQIRQESKVPVIMLTARGEEQDELFGFELGVDEYISKPFSPKILVARIKAILNRTEGKQKENKNYGGIEINTEGRTVSVDGKQIELSLREYELLKYLLDNENVALSRDKILNNVWNYDYYGDSRTIDSHIKKIRHKLGKKGKYIKTIRGVGYKFEVKMKLKNTFKSIRFRLFGTLCVSIVLIIFCLIIINNVVLETFYLYSKTSTAIHICQSINSYYNGIFTYNIKDKLREQERTNNIDILILDENFDVVYCSNQEIIDSVNKLESIYGSRNKIIYSRNNVIVQSIEDAKDNQYLMLKASLDNGYTAYIKIQVKPIKATVRVSNDLLLIIGVLMIIIAAVIASVIANKFTKPILQLNRITKKMANLDFSQRYRISDTEDEINMLGRNINEMSDKLELTINRLQSNNSKLEQNIEEKSKIDEMRKQFISDVSHELKTPIALIQGYAEGLIENVNSDEESRKFYAEVILDESNKMDTMVKRLLELMKLEYQERKFNDTEFDLTELIKEELRRNTVVIKENNIKIEFEDKKKIKVFADQEYIEQVVSNYLTNAIKHAEEKNGEKKIIIRTENKKDKVRLYVYNTGENIPKEYINKIWGRFYKIDSSRNRNSGGTGIGLALVKAIMNNYNNEYGVKNHEEGVEFYCDINRKSH